MKRNIVSFLSSSPAILSYNTSFSLIQVTLELVNSEVQNLYDYMLSTIHSASISGLHPLHVLVEIHVFSRGLPYTKIVGLPGKVVQESKERVKSALLQTNKKFPAKKIIINLAPTSIPKQGPSLDLALAVGYGQAYGMLPLQTNSTLFFGELSLTGFLRYTKGAVAFVSLAKQLGFTTVVFPKENFEEVSMISEINLVPFHHISEVFHFLSTGRKPVCKGKKTQPQEIALNINNFSFLGKPFMFRAMEIALSGNHHTLLFGPPGTGKTVLAQSFRALLPLLSSHESLEVNERYSLAGLLEEKKPLFVRPFRSPHQTISQTKFIGNIGKKQVGELALAHYGVLFLDELSEFLPTVLTTLRKPMEEYTITLHGSQGFERFATNFMLIAATNSCRCGFMYSSYKTCMCSSADIQKFKRKLPGPLMERFDITLLLSEKNTPIENKSAKTDDLFALKRRIEKCRMIQIARYKGINIDYNSQLTSDLVFRYCALSHAAKQFLQTATDKFHFSFRRYISVVRVSQTIADLEQSPFIQKKHIAEALQLKQEV